MHACYALFAWGIVAASIVSCLRRRSRKQKKYCLLAAIASTIALFPIGGLLLGQWCQGLLHGPSPVLTLLMVVKIVESLSRSTLLRTGAWTSAWMFGMLAGWIVYPAALGIGSVDVYPLGFQGMTLPLVLAVITAALLFHRNQFGYVLIFAAALWQLGLIASPNLWDYLIDPAYAFLGTAMTGGHVASTLWANRRRQAEISLS